MFKFIKDKENKINKNKSLVFGLISVFLCGIGFGIIAPVVPFLVEPYISNQDGQVFFIALLTSVYALCVFFAAPILGVLSDRYGRRPLLLVCLLGSVIGYLIFGVGGALWVLFLGRIIDGITGGSISIIYAYFADITPVNKRTKYFGWVSAVSGVGFMIGPTIGGFLAKFGYSVPMYFGALITFFNFVFGYFCMPESLKERERLKKVSASNLNPLIQVINIFKVKNLKRLLFAAFLIWIPNGSLQAVFSQFTIDTFNWQPELIGLVFSIMGIQDIISQGIIMPRFLIKFSDLSIATIGMASEIIGYVLIAASAFLNLYLIFIVGMFVFGFGDSIFGPAFNSMVSKSVEQSEQGRIQGGCQSIQSLARIIGPIIGGQIYISIGPVAPAIMGVIFISFAIPVLYKGLILNRVLKIQVKN